MGFTSRDKKFREAYSNYYPLVYNIIFKKVRNIEDAEDICHDVFVAFYDKLEEIENQKSWIYGTINNIVANHYTKKGIALRDTVDIGDMENSVELAFENGARDIRIIINEALENDKNYKNEKERILFELIALKGFNYIQAGRQLGMTRRMAQYKYKNIVIRIINYLKEKGISEVEDLL